MVFHVCKRDTERVHDVKEQGILEALGSTSKVSKYELLHKDYVAGIPLQANKVA